jgi:predicted Rossmann-fold nucleotide-binding protein
MKKQISIFGKSTVNENTQSYKIIKQLAYQLVSGENICMHGGYAGGIMQAVADGAQEAINTYGLDGNLNIGVPEERFDKQWPRVPIAIFTEPAIDIYDRLRTITQSDIFIVAPDGGDGTSLEADIVIHENSINELLGKPVKPIIFIEGADKKWTNLFQARLDNLDISKSSINDYSWVSFIRYSNNDHIKNVVTTILNKINQID